MISKRGEYIAPRWEDMESERNREKRELQEQMQEHGGHPAKQLPRRESVADKVKWHNKHFDFVCGFDYGPIIDIPE